MASRVHEIAFHIAGKLDGSLSKSVLTAGGQLDQINSKLKNLESARGNVTRFRALHTEIGKTETKFASAQAEVNRLAAEIRKTENPTKQLTQQFESAQRSAGKLKTKLSEQKSELHGLREGLRSAGVNTRNLTADNAKLVSQVERLTRAQHGLREVNASIGANLQRRAALRGQMMGAVAAAAAVAAPVRSAMQEQDAQIRLRTVLNADDKDQALNEARSMARELAQSGIVGLSEGYDIQYGLNSAGLEASAARAAAGVVAAVAKVTSGVPGQVSEVIATAYNNLGGQMEGDTAAKMERLGDLLTKVQFKYQIRDFGQLGESMKYASASMAGFNVNLDQGVAVVGALNSAGLQGGQAGTAFSAMMRQLSKAAGEMGTDLVRGADGTMDLLQTLTQLDDSMADMDIDERAAAIQKMFGDEGARAVIPLLNNIENLGDAMADVSENSRGLVNKEVTDFLNSASGQMAALRGSASVAGAAIGSILLPAINGIVGPMAAALSWLAKMAERFPTVTKVVVGAAAGLLALKVATIAGGYALTFLVGGFLQVKKAVLLARTAWLLYSGSTVAATIATKAAAVASRAMAAAQWLFNAAMTANPIGLVVVAIGALVAAGVYLIRNWDAVKAKALELWNAIPAMVRNAWQSVTDFLGSINLYDSGAAIIGTLVDGIKSKIGGIKDSIKDGLSAARDFLPFSDAKRGPFSDLTESGASVIQTIAKGIRGTAADALTGPMAERMGMPDNGLAAGVNPDAGAAGPQTDGLATSGAELIGALVDSIKAKIGGIRDGLSAARDFLPTTTDGLGTTKASASAISMLVAGIRAAAAGAPAGTERVAGQIDGLATGVQPSRDRGDPAGGLAADVRPAGAGRSSMQVTFSPQITLPAGSPAETRRTVEQALDAGSRELERRLQQVMENRERLSYV